MKYLVKIDRKSIKENPNAGNQTYFEQGCPDCSFVINVPHVLVEHPRVRAISYNSILNKDGFKTEAEYKVWGTEEEINDIIIPLGKKYKENFIFTINYNVQTHYSITREPKYHYEYKDKKVKCRHCKATFSYKNLKDENDYDYDDNYYGRSNICPKCDEEDCCELEFENIESAIRSMKGLPSLIVGSGENV